MNYDLLIAEAQPFVPADVRVDMCRHPSVTEPAFWLFRTADGRERQIGGLHLEPGGQWRASRMNRGMPYAEKVFSTLCQALKFAASSDYR